ncbi:MAG: SpoIIE family protein phosphatase [Streptosporangiales bacterium]|nr:SpoIIE family protein phosphatase [Streptosporangiales bacterium]
MKFRPVRATPVRVRAALRHNWATFRRRFLFKYRVVLITLVTLAVAIGVGGLYSPAWFPPSAVIVTMLAGGLLLKRRSLAFLYGVVTVVLVVDAIALGLPQVGPGLAVTIAVTATVAYMLAGVRERIGVQGLRGEQMLLELRDRLRAQGTMPKLPRGWRSKSVLEQAGGSSFGGDFLVSSLHDDKLEVALVDVSGKGVDAGTRALLLSGAFGGLLASVPAGDFLATCNEYLLRTSVGEGFVTAVHLSLDLSTGEYVVESAGHPPAVQFDAGSGSWQITEAKGMVLGVVPELKCAPVHGQLRTGDALMLYTDGLIEAPGRDIDAGIDRLLGEADRLITEGFSEGARDFVRTLGKGKEDDCAMVVIWRT